jgi:HEAT repeat protein
MIWWTLQQLKSSKWEARLEAAKKMGASRERKAVPALLERLQDENAEVRGAAIDALGLIAHPASAEPLSSALAAVPGSEARDSGEAERLAAALSALGKPAVRPVLALLRSEDKETRRWAALILGRLRDPEAVEPLAEKLDDNRSDVRKFAAEALGAIADERGARFLVKVLSHRDSETRRAAAEALGRIKSDSATDALVRAVTDSSEGVQLAAVTALGRIPGLRSAAALRTAAESGRKSLREAAVSALQAMAFTPDTPGDRAAFFVHTGNFNGALREGNAAEAPLVAALASREPARRLQAVKALASLKLASSLAPLQEALRDHDRGVQEAAADALAGFGPAATEYLGIALESPDASVQRQAARALGFIGDPKMAAALASVIYENRRTQADYPESLEAARAAADSLRAILASSADTIDSHALARIAEVPDCTVVELSAEQVPQEKPALDCSLIRRLALEAKTDRQRSQ